MPKVTLSPIIGALEGAIGDLVFFRQANDTYLRMKGERTEPLSQAQVAQLDRLGKASRWAKQTLLDPAIKAAYKRACHDHLTPHNVAVADYLHGPVIQSINLDSYTGKPGGVIRIMAGDDFNIIRLSVVIRTVDGELLEEGLAERNTVENAWQYSSRSAVAPRTPILIEATAVDLPGNEAKAKAFYYVPGP